MTWFKRMLFFALMAALMIPMLATPALAEGEWRALYLNELKQGEGAKRAVALCDLTGDGNPELIVMSVSAGKAPSLKVHTTNGAQLAPAAFDLSSLSLTGVKSVSMQLRTKSGTPCLYFSITAQSTNAHLALTMTGGELKAVYSDRKLKSGGKTQLFTNGSAVTSAQFSKAQKAFLNSYPKKGSVPVKLLNSGDRATAIQTKFDQLRKQHTKFATIKALKLSKGSATLEAGKSLKLGVSFTPATAISDAISWISSDEKVATVDKNGQVKALRAGNATISAKSAGGIKKSCKLTVKGPTPTGVSLDETILTLIKGGNQQLTATIAPEGAGGGLKWASSNTQVATVSKDGMVTAHKAGKATITVSTSNKKTAACKLVVNDGPAVIVDISQHNYSTKMDWKKISDNVNLLILRCGVTRTDTAPIGVGKDDRFAFYAQKCKEYDIPFGVYFYGKCADEETAKQEAQMTWSVASPYKPLFYIYDVEESRLNKKLIETYMKTLQSLGAKKTGYYIAHHLYSNYKLDTSLVDFIWIPRYGKNDGTVSATPDYTCDLHQYTSQGRVPGFAGVVDVSRLMGRKSLKWFLTP